MATRYLFRLLCLGAMGVHGESGEHYAAVGEPPVCEVDVSGKTHVYYTTAQHPSFKCTHTGSTCACTLQHPTHHKGGCKQFESKALGRILYGAGDCTASGQDFAPWDSAATVTVLAGDRNAGGSSDGTGSSARFQNPTGVAMDGDVAVVAGRGNNNVRRITISTGQVTTLATLPKVFKIALQGDTALVSDGSNTIRRVTVSTGDVSTLAGGPGSGFSSLRGIAMDGDVAVFTDSGNHKIRLVKISTGEVSILAGSSAGFQDGTGTNAQFRHPNGLGMKGDIVVVADTENHSVRHIVISTGVVTTLGGSGSPTGSGNKDGLGGRHEHGGVALFNRPYGAAVQGDDVLVADERNGAVRRISLSTKMVSTLATGISIISDVTMQGDTALVATFGEKRILRLTNA